MTWLTIRKPTEGCSANDDEDDDDVPLALVIQNVMRMRRVTFSSVACLALLYFFILSHKWRDFRKKVTEHKIYILIFSTTFVGSISHSKKKLRKYDHKCIVVFM